MNWKQVFEKNLPQSYLILTFFFRFLISEWAQEKKMLRLWKESKKRLKMKNWSINFWINLVAKKTTILHLTSSDNNDRLKLQKIQRKVVQADEKSKKSWQNCYKLNKVQLKRLCSGKDAERVDVGDCVYESDLNTRQCFFLISRVINSWN